MSRPFEVHLPLEIAYRRRVLFAIELLDAATLERISQGIKVVAEGLRGKPVLNSGGIFVWLDEDFTRLQKILVKPGVRPYEEVELTREQVKRPLTTIPLPPRVDYPFAAGITGLRGTLVEKRIEPAEPVANSKVRVQWLDEQNAWHDSPMASRTEAGGDFAAILGLTPAEAPLLNTDGTFTVRVRVSRAGFNDRSSGEMKILAGRIADPPIFVPPPDPMPDRLTLAWDELMP